MAVGRNDVVRSGRDAASLIEDGMTVAVGGLLTSNHPMVVIRELIRQGRTGLTVIGAASAGLEIDLMIGAGIVRKLITPFVSGEGLVGTGPCYRRALEQGLIENWEITEGMQYAGLEAAARDLPFLPVRGGLGSDTLRLNPDLTTFRDPLQGELLIAVPAIKADVALIHVQRADSYGNGQHLGATFGDRLMAFAADKVILTAERIVANEVIRRSPERTTIAYADAVVEAPFGSHPFGSHACYREDTEMLEQYVSVATAFRKGEEEEFNLFLKEFVLSCDDHTVYLERIGFGRLFSLRRAYDYMTVGGDNA